MYGFVDKQERQGEPGPAHPLWLRPCIYKDLTIEINFVPPVFFVRVVFIGGMISIRVLSEMQNGMGSIRLYV
jgi:hypothetical protein